MQKKEPSSKFGHLSSCYLSKQTVAYAHVYRRYEKFDWVWLFIWFIAIDIYAFILQIPSLSLGKWTRLKQERDLCLHEIWSVTALVCRTKEKWPQLFRTYRPGEDLEWAVCQCLHQRRNTSVPTIGTVISNIAPPLNVQVTGVKRTKLVTRTRFHKDSWRRWPLQLHHPWRSYIKLPILWTRSGS